MAQFQKKNYILFDKKMEKDIKHKRTEESSDYFSIREEEQDEDFIVTKKPTKNIFGKNKSSATDSFDQFFDSVRKSGLKGEPVYLVDTGEKLGVVYDLVRNENKNIVGLEIKDDVSGAILKFPLEQFYKDSLGLILIPSWYIKAVSTIKKIEFKERVSPEISPELTSLLLDGTVSNKELFEILVEYDDDMASDMQEAALLKKILSIRVKILEKQRLALKDRLVALTEQRLMQDIDRKQFSESIMDQRRKAKIFDINIGKCKELLHRLDRTSFGVLGKNISFNHEKKDDSFKEDRDDLPGEKIMTNAIESRKNSFAGRELIEDEYDESYAKLKVRDSYIRELLTELDEKNDEIFRLRNKLQKRNEDE